MGFWIFMLCFIDMTPLLMIVFGRFFMRNSSVEINGFFGYRTRRSMASEEAWAFAQKHWGRQAFWLGLLSLVLSTIAMLFCMDWDTDGVGNYGLVVIIVQLVVLLVLPIFSTERELKKRFG